MTTLHCFKACDVRGVVPEQLNPDIAYAIGRAYASTINCSCVVVGHDIRLSSESLSQSLITALLDSGIDVIDIGLCGTEEVYFAVQHLQADGGICVTASHNPAQYNGMKFVGPMAIPIGADNGLLEIQTRAEQKNFKPPQPPGNLTQKNLRSEYAKELLSFIEVSTLKPLRIVTNAGNGGAGLVIDTLSPELPFEFIRLQHQPDGTFPNGVPNPLLPENRSVTANEIVKSGADLGIAWDGDFDRCFFFDEYGHFVEGYYLVGLLAETLLKRHPGEVIIHDPRLYWATQNTVASCDGQAEMTKTGHVFIKESMRQHNAIYGGEMSAHHYFRDFGYCDNGHIPWLLICELISNSGKSLSQLVSQAQKAFPCSGEINLEVQAPNVILGKIEQHFKATSKHISKLDGLDIVFDDWRCSLRISNTEPLMRLNVESRGNQVLMEEKTNELLALITAFAKD